ncbi:hypothetical protein LZ554_008129 [Drepanopeziza brunnea f. sp. 'monogermtubi']|nr:hypothetical protein LZ554_008129 [Drepanopeziza brunnea f. sp. 'monogermtubi']
MATIPKVLTADSLKTWLQGIFIGDPSIDAARAYCEASLSKNYLRLQTGAPDTNFEQAVEKTAMFRSLVTKWEAEVELFIQDGNRLAVRMIVDWVLGDALEQRVELMLMAERDAEGRFEKLWEAKVIEVYRTMGEPYSL